MIEIIKQLPWSAVFLVAAYFFFKDHVNDTAGWVCLVIAIVALFLVVRFSHYENIIAHKDKQIDKDRKHVMDTQKNAAETFAQFTTNLAQGGYGKELQTTQTE